MRRPESPALPIPRTKGLTYADYCQLPDDGNRYEIIDGELYMTPAPTWGHQSVAYWIARWLGPWIDDHDLGVLRFAPLDVILANDTTFQPDLVFISKARIPYVVEQSVHGAPDLAIEILSPSTAGKDQVTKRNSYAKHGIREYWLVDPVEQAVTVLTLAGKRFTRLGVVSGDKKIPSRVLPGLPVPVRDFFRP